MITEIKKVAPNADLLYILANNDYDSLSIESLVDLLHNWTNHSKKEDTPASYLGDKIYANLINYWIILNLDRQIGNEQPFIPDQDYGQEVQRILKGQTLSMVDGDIETDSLVKKDKVYNFNSEDTEEPGSGTSEVNPSITGFNIQFFTDTPIESILEEDTHNFTKYKELCKIDATINNSRRFNAKRNYGQELIRQHRAAELMELVKQDNSFINLFYTVDYAIQDIFYRNLADPKSDDMPYRIKLLW